MQSSSSTSAGTISLASDRPPLTPRAARVGECPPVGAADGRVVERADAVVLLALGAGQTAIAVQGEKEQEKSQM